MKARRLLALAKFLETKHVAKKIRKFVKAGGIPYTFAVYNGVACRVS
jgi:hypothetical protein